MCSMPDQKKFVGDVHAVALVTSSASHMPRLQAALRSLVDSMEVRYDRPDPSWRDHSRRILEVTCLRRKDDTLGGVVGGAEASGLEWGRLGVWVVGHAWRTV